MDIFVVLQTMIKLFILLVLGFVLFKVGIFDKHTNKSISALIVNVTSPALVIYSVTTVQSTDRSLVFKLVGASFLMYMGFVVLSKLVVRFLPIPKADRAVYECMMVFANTGFMGYPVLLSVFDTDSVFYCSMIHLCFNFFVYTYGVILLTQKDGEKFKIDPKVLLTPGLILSLSAIVIYLLNIHIPTLVLDVVSTVGGLTSPLSMMMIGASLATYPVLKCITDWRSYMFAPIRLFLIGIVTMVVCRTLSINPYYSNIAIITNSMPVASMVLMLATQYNANTETVTKNIIVSTVLSVITIPIVVGFFLI